MNLPFVISSKSMEIGGFSQCTLSKSIESIAGYFSFSFKDKRILGARPLDIPFGDEVIEIRIGRETRLKAFLEVVTPSKGSDGRVIRLGGREVTCDLVDCTLDRVRTLTGSLQVVLREITKPFELIEYQAISDAAQNKVTTRTNPGEKYWEQIERLSRKAGALLWTNGDGRINIGTTKGERVDLVLDERVIADGASATYSSADIFSRYIVRGDSETDQEMQGWGTEAKSSYTHASDFIRRPRPLCIKGENKQTASATRQRAIWESNIRLARGIKATLPLRGLSEDALRLIDINRIIRVKDDALGLDREMLITSYTITADTEEGLTALIEVTVPGAYELQPLSASEVKKELGGNLKFNW